MQIQELRSLSTESIKAKLGELRLELNIEKRKIASTGVSSKKVKARDMHRTIARLLTILRERGAQ